jgi:hypothetical protein
LIAEVSHGSDLGLDRTWNQVGELCNTTHLSPETNQNEGRQVRRPYLSFGFPRRVCATTGFSERRVIFTRNPFLGKTRFSTGPEI